jgi:hypothetical protein
VNLTGGRYIGSLTPNPPTGTFAEQAPRIIFPQWDRYHLDAEGNAKGRKMVRISGTSIFP